MNGIETWLLNEAEIIQKHLNSCKAENKEVHIYEGLFLSYQKGIQAERQRCIGIVEDYGCGYEPDCEYECSHLDIKKEIITGESKRPEGKI